MMVAIAYGALRDGAIVLMIPEHTVGDICQRNDCDRLEGPTCER